MNGFTMNGTAMNGTVMNGTAMRGSADTGWQAWTDDQRVGHLRNSGAIWRGGLWRRLTTSRAAVPAPLATAQSGRARGASHGGPRSPPVGRAPRCRRGTPHKTWYGPAA